MIKGDRNILYQSKPFEDIAVNQIVEVLSIILIGTIIAVTIFICEMIAHSTRKKLKIIGF